MKKIVFFVALFVIAAPLSAAMLKPENVGQFFVEPGTETLMKFTSDEAFSGEFRLVNLNGEPVEGAKLGIDVRDRSVTVSGIVLPQGFWELQCGEQCFGIVSQPAFQGERDKFFAIDGALSWLVRDDGMRDGLVKAARRSGIGMIRERVSWGAIEKNEGAFDWETDRRYEKLRKLCKECDIELLELFHDAPPWTDKIEKYPGDLLKTARSWETIARRWQDTWGALEIWNEPEISFGAELPSDQYVPMAKAIAYRLKKSGVTTPIFGGVMSHFHPAWLDTAAENGLLDAMDGFSFHTYDRAPSMETLVGRYRTWLTKYGHESMPLWLTECGRPWKRGTERPGPEQDLASAVDIVMKGVEARCCGVDRYFPFVYPYYDENDNNFGMMDKLGTPCRSMAAYVQMIRVLSGAGYLGDLKFDDPAVLRSRVFKTKSGEALLVLYTAALKLPPEPLKLPEKVLRAESVTGSPITLKNGNELSVEPTDLYYLWLERNSVAGLLNTDTGAMTLDKSAKKPKPEKKAISPLVLRFQYDKEKLSATPGGYFVSREVGDDLPVTVRIFNLEDGDRSCKIEGRFGKESLSSRKITIKGQGFADATWTVPLQNTALETGEAQQVRMLLDGVKMPSLVFSLRGEATWVGTASTVAQVVAIPVDDMARWSKNIAGIGTMTMTTPEDDADGAVWRMTATFKEGDRWVYPRFHLPSDTGLEKYSGLIVEARCVGKATPRFFLFEKNGAGYIVGPVFQTDGKWHVVKLPFDTFQHAGATRPDPNDRLDLDQVDFISLGANTKEPECTLEIRKVALYR